MKYYTDGSYRASKKKGAYGAVAVSPSGEVNVVVQGVELNTTNNVMEMKAVLHLLEYLQGIHKLTVPEVYCDSEYVVNGLTQWYPNWKLNGFRSYSGKSIKNLDLWHLLYTAYMETMIDLRWVKGHADCAGNIAVDTLVSTLTDTD